MVVPAEHLRPHSLKLAQAFFTLKMRRLVNFSRPFGGVRYFHKPKKINKRAVVYFDKLSVQDAKYKLLNLLDELNVANEQADDYNFRKKGIHLQFGTVHNKKLTNENRHLLYMSMVGLLDDLGVMYKADFGNEKTDLEEFLKLEEEFVNSLCKADVNKRLPTIFIPVHGLERYDVNRANRAIASILLYNTAVRYAGLLSVIVGVTYVIPTLQGYI